MIMTARRKLGLQLMAATLLALVGFFTFAMKAGETNISGIIEYVFDAHPQEIKPKMYNWEVRLNTADSTNGIYEIIQITRPLDVNGENPVTTNVLIGVSPMSRTEMIVPNEEGIIDFKLYVGDKEPKQNMDAPGNIGQPIIFSGKGTGKAGVDWIVLPGSKVEKITPSDKGTMLTGGRLTIIQFVVTNDSGQKFQADVMLRRR
jgi:hypothetical protein